MLRLTRVMLFVVGLLALVPTLAHAQASITGVVRDPSGAVLPGVTVEASSPVLIEKVRSVVTDGSGQYRIVDLRPGTYIVTFTLSGFSVVRREGIELTGTFVATVDADLRVGALEETITVTGDSPIVDIQRTTQQRVFDQQVIEAIPAGRSHINMVVLIPGLAAAQPGRGALADVGGTNNLQNTTFTIHGIVVKRFYKTGSNCFCHSGAGFLFHYEPMAAGLCIQNRHKLVDIYGIGLARSGHCAGNNKYAGNKSSDRKSC